MFIETSNPRRSGDEATLISPDFRVDKSSCLRLKAHMYGRDIGYLKIEKIKGPSKTTLLAVVGTQGSRWFSVNVNLPEGDTYKVINLFKI